MSKRLILAIFALILGLALAAQDAETPLMPDPALLSGKLENGLSYYIMRNAKPANIAELRLYVDAGSVNEDEDQRGLAHFTEHMAFNGTKNFGRTEVVEYLSSIGMGFMNGLNGMTSHDFTVYTFKVPTDKQDQLRKGMQILSDMSSQVSFDAAEIERERGVIIEEWRMGQDAGTRVRDAQNAVSLGGSRYAERSPIGTYEVLSTFKPETIKRFYRDWYRPDLQSVIIVGDFEPQAMLELVREYFGPIPAVANPRPRDVFSVPENLSPQVIVATDKEYPRNVLQVMWKKAVNPIKTVEAYYEGLKLNLLTQMLNTRLDEHSRTANPPYSFAAVFDTDLTRTMSAVTAFAMFTPGRSEDALSTILTEAERVQRYGFLPSEFARAKTELKREAQTVLDGKDTQESENIAWELFGVLSSDGVFLGPEQKSFLLTALVDQISLEEVNAMVAQMVPEKNMFIGIGAPAREGLAYPSEQRLLEIAQTVNQLEIAPYEDTTVNEPLMAQVPAPKPIKKESYDKKSGVRTWVLANGATVYLKKTDFKSDEVLITATSPGGYTQYPPEIMPAAVYLPRYISDSGFGKFDSVALDKATAGKMARVSFTLGEYNEGMQASCSPKDMETMFQMIHQYATNPRFEQQDFDSFIQRTRSGLENRDLEPQNAFMDSLSSGLYNGNPYHQPVTKDDLNSITLERMERVFRDRFADFSDFSFVIVGNFDEASLREYCRTYLANLPQARRKDSVRDAGIRPFEGLKNIRFQKGESDRCFASLATSGSYELSQQNAIDLTAMLMVLNEKLRENIREERSGVYFVQAWSETNRYAKPHFTLQTYMACSPARVDELNLAILATIDSLKAGQFGEKYLTSTTTTLQKTYEENIRNNSYWANLIARNSQNGLPLTGFLDNEKYYAKIDKASIVKAAKRYLTFDKNRLSVIMLPAKPIDSKQQD